MGLTSALYTGLSGLDVHEASIETIGNNIANVNTTAFKGSRSLFQTQFYETLSQGSEPNEITGGVNPMQVGQGATVASTRQNFNTGPIETTGVRSDLAIEGNGFFILDTDGAVRRFTRDGAFALDASNTLVSADGFRVQGFAADANGNIDPTTLIDINVPLGFESAARATTNVLLDGDLSAAGTIGTASSETRSSALSVIGGGLANGNTALTAFTSPTSAGGSVLTAGETITLQGATKGTRELPTANFVVGQDGSTLQDFANWLQEQLGIQTDPGLPGNPGVFIENGQLIVRGNAGIDNAIEIEPTDLISSTGGSAPFGFTQTASGNGSSVFTGFTVFDSLGNPRQVQMTFVLESTSNDGPVWRFFAESPDASGSSRALGNGTVAFDINGNVRGVSGNQFTLPLDNTGAGTPVNFAVDMSQLLGLATSQSGVIAADQDGFPPGTLTNYAIQRDGTVTGTFSNGISQTLARVALAQFPNAEGLVAEADNMFSAGPNAGALAIVNPGEFGTGSIRSGALEGSNVDLGREFIGLVTASTGFQASSRLITVTNDMLNQLLLVIR